MLTPTSKNVQSAIDAISAKLDYDRAVDAERLMQAALEAYPDVSDCNEDDTSDPDYNEPEEWGMWADRDTYELGPNLPPDEDTIQTSPLWKAWLTRVPLKE